ncbi:tail fiber domain-containing protein [Pantoea agglomerans]|uniref:tail fiber domain-containing protein n=1 Tax=Enterobacter agglomerans TaxID=549 RepID=UPI00289E36C5|nr:tail fiber domain-containing protein [Pantoea agglomerans]WNK36862.1 tail fiber domain-containing protein [Pantoea agglomerans]
MPAGTIALTNNSTTVTGTGTNFTSELKANDFLVAIVGGVTYTLGVQSVNSATGLTLVTAYNGPTATGVAWTAVPNAALVGITAQVAADVAKAIRGLNLDKANWQQVYSGSGNITVNLPDGSQYSGPSWNSLSTSLASKANTSSLGNSASRDVGTTANTVAAGNDARLGTVNGKSGGDINSAVSFSSAGGNAVVINGVIPESGGSPNRVNYMVHRGASTQYDIYHGYYLLSGNYHCYRFVQNATETLRIQSNGYLVAVGFSPTSDSQLKFNKKFIEGSLKKAMSLRGMSYDLQGQRRAGVIAQDVEKVVPEVITNSETPLVLEDGTILRSSKSLDYSGVTALHTEAIKDIVALMLQCLEEPEVARKNLLKLTESINYSTEDENKTDLRMEWAMLEQPEQVKVQAEPNPT